MFSLFKKKTSEHLIIFDITTNSVAGGYVEISSSTPPRFFYTKRVPVQEGTEETKESRLLEAFKTLSEALLKEGAPLHYRATKTSHIDGELMSVGYPWQQTQVHTKTFQRPESFIFTEEMRDYALKEIVPEEGKELTGRFLLATLLNGYHIGTPIGKEVKRADLLMLSSSVEKNIIETLTKASKKHFHNGNPKIITFAPTMYFVLQDVYPHEEEVLLMNVSQGATDIAIVKKHLLIDVMTIPVGSEIYAKTNENGDLLTPESKNILGNDLSADEERWIERVAAAFRDCASREALPRTIFLVVEEKKYHDFKRLLDSKNIRELWLSNTTLNVIPIGEKQLSSFIKTEGETQQDLYLSFLALFYTKHRELVP